MTLNRNKILKKGFKWDAASRMMIRVMLRALDKFYTFLSFLKNDQEFVPSKTFLRPKYWVATQRLHTNCVKYIFNRYLPSGKV